MGIWDLWRPNPGDTMKEVTMRDLLEAGVHFGHQKRFWNPKMAPYIYGIRQKIHIINLENTLPLFRRVLQMVRQIASNRGKVLFVGTKYAAREIIKEEAIRCGMPYVNQRWLGGMLTNYKTIRQSIKRLKALENMLSNEDALQGMTKKEVLNLMREKDKLATSLDGIKNMGGLPDVLFVIDVEQEKIAISEARRLGIPVIAVVDTNCSPDNIDYIIPGNDDAARSIRLYCRSLADTIIDARGPVSDEIEKFDDKEEKVVIKKVVKKRTALQDIGLTEVDEDLILDETEEEAQPVKSKPSTKPAVEKTSEHPKTTKTHTIAKKVASKAPHADSGAAHKTTANVKNATKSSAKSAKGTAKNSEKATKSEVSDSHEKATSEK